VPLPIYNPQIVAQGLARLTGAFGQKPNVRAWLAACLQPAQDLEDATWQVLGARFLASATRYTLPETNAVFDTIGALVGQPRNGYSDSDYVSLIYLRIAVNRSLGRTTDWSRFGGILLTQSLGPLGYFEGGANASATYGSASDPSSTWPFLNSSAQSLATYPVVLQIAGGASLCLVCYGMIVLNPVLVASILADAVPNGARGTLVYTTGPFVVGTTGDLVCGSFYDSTAGNGGLSSVYTDLVGGGLPSALEMN
jgi:hypothetical protein